ncbi:hypothetical protein C1631_007840 [Chryseobacterium phosphatilyticum]|uniref:Uncharacterized protein n=1 Tax=Chryseobacterium phosphatilyticum TaxID=475075 RepID=A0A316XB77_9FLAO|nr:hypothetical protein [Chryseobacterium phosphatilyticum]PWN69916.1 hypothetical protein C1631_007840 [Chryseobacterium phosphatilyticum]
MRNLSILFILILLTSCSDTTTREKSNVRPTQYSFDNMIPDYSTDTLFIKSSFADCGEWGGHEELIKIYRLEKKFKLTYIKYEVNCEARDQFGLTQIEKFNKNITLSQFQKMALMNYMERLMKSQFLDKEISHSGNYFSLENTKGNLKISYGGNHPLLLENYNDLLFKLEFPKVVIQQN